MSPQPGRPQDLPPSPPEAALEQGPGFGTLLFSVSRAGQPSPRVKSLSAGGSHPGTSSVSERTSHQTEPAFRSTEGTDTARGWKSCSHPAGTQPHTYLDDSPSCHQLQKRQQCVSKSLQLGHDTAHYKGNTSSPHQSLMKRHFTSSKRTSTTPPPLVPPVCSIDLKHSVSLPLLLHLSFNLLQEIHFGRSFTLLPKRERKRALAEQGKE